MKKAATQTMKWHCLGCHQNFQGPADHAPAGGCPRCGSHKIIDCNAETQMELSMDEIADMLKNGWKIASAVVSVALPPVHPECVVMTRKAMDAHVKKLVVDENRSHCQKFMEAFQAHCPVKPIGRPYQLLVMRN